MKNLLHSLAAVLFVATVALAPAASSHAASPDDQTELGARMEKLNAPWRKLRRQVADPAKNAGSLELLAKIREAAKGAPEAEVREMALAHPAVAQFLAGQTVRKVIVVPDRIVNIVAN